MPGDGHFLWMWREVSLVTFDDAAAEIGLSFDQETAHGGASESCFDAFADFFPWALTGIRGGRDWVTVERDVASLVHFDQCLRGLLRGDHDAGCYLVWASFSPWHSCQDFDSLIASKMETRRRHLAVLLDCDLAGAWLGIRAATPQYPCHEIDHESLPCTCRDGKATAMLDEVALCYVRVFYGGFGQKAATCREGVRAFCCLAICLILEVDGVEAKEICGSVSLLDQLCLGLCAHRLICGRLSWRHVEGGCGGRTPSLQPIRFEFLGMSTLPAEVSPIT
ncbi:hypothetical protein CSPX01_01829 [Colletotrichum filicis]|nr:hypothetical protein CSPX01_01829 [Colletotrichum filicis]